MIPGGTPLGAVPLSSIGGVGFGTIPPSDGFMSATGGITFGGSAHASLSQFFTSISATGGIAFGGSPYAYPKVYARTTGGITFNGSPLLKVAGKPLKFTALPDKFVFRAVPEDYEFSALTFSFTFRGVPE